MAIPFPRADAEAAVKLIQDIINEGKGRLSGKPSVFYEAKRRTGISSETWRSRIKVAKSEYGLAPVEPERPAFTISEAIEVERNRQRDRDLIAENKALREALIEAQDIRSGVLQLTNPPLKPRFDDPPRARKKGSRTVIIHLSDIHCGERVDPDEMDGINAYSIEIFRNRLSRLAQTAKDLMTVHWKGDPPEKIILILGGDMISGEIHAELERTNEALAAPAVKECAQRLAGVVKLLREVAPVDVYSLPGNHGRLTKKPESKGMAINSFDTLIAQVVEMVLADVKGIRFIYSTSGDVLIQVYGWRFVAAHGDRIGSKGGQGFLGALATILRGMAKVHAYYAAQGVVIDYVLTAHLHTSGDLQLGFANGSLIGPSQYSRDLRARPEQSQQNFIVVHSEIGVIDYRKIKCGHPSEGTIYQPRAA